MCFLCRAARNPDVTTHQLRQPFGDGQPKSGPTVFAGSRCIRLLECLEQAPDLLLAQADASIADGKFNELAVLTVLQDPNLDDDLALLGELDRVIAEVDQDLPQPQRIASELGGERGVDVKD